MRTLNLIAMFMIMLGTCNSIDNPSIDNPYFYEPPKDLVLTSQILVEKLKPTVKSLSLKGHREVDDDFIKYLSASKKSESLINIDLSGTSVTEKSLEHILGSKTLGTKRDFPQISARYDMPLSKIYLNVQSTNVKETKGFQKPVSDVLLHYGKLSGKKTAKDANGIKLLMCKL